MPDRLSSDDLAHFRAAARIKTQSDAVWACLISTLAPRYNLSQYDTVDDDGQIVRGGPAPVPAEPTPTIDG